MAATERRQIGSVLAAALALPGLMPAAHAENAPENGIVSIKYLSYQDSQPGFERVHVHAPSVYALTPIGTQWSVEGSATYDSVSGASPRYHTAVSGASHMNDKRTAAEAKLTRYFDRSAYSLGVSGSTEHDYQSAAVSLDARFSSDDNNTTWNVGVGHSNDSITSVNDKTLHEKKRTTEIIVGVTQAVTPIDLVQANLTFSHGRGFYNDPYKQPDIRPNKRDMQILLLRWNHHFESLGASLRTSYRYYQDTYQIRSHTLGVEWVQPVNDRFTVTPSVRLYSQSAASFYYDPVYDPVLGAPYPPGYFTNPPQYISGDQRLSAFGGVTAGLKLSMRLDDLWTADLKGELYEQRGNWRIFGTGSPGLEPFRATFLQAGLSRKF